MRILIDILHPAHVHFFRNFHSEMESRGHELCITARSKEFSVELLRGYGLAYRVISSQRAGPLGLAGELAGRTLRLLGVMREFRPDVLTGIMGPSIALAGRAGRVPAVVFYDTEFARQSNWFVYPLAHSVCTPDCYRGRVRGRHVTYPGYHELAYLHPARFHPDPDRLSGFGVRREEPYFVVRFVSWQAVHDRREVGLGLDQKREIVARLERHGRVLLSSEGPLPPDLADRMMAGPIEDVHHLLAFARMAVGESATMASEAAVLGVPAVFIAKTGRGYTDEQEERYGLVRHFTEDRYGEALAAIDEILCGYSAEALAEARRRLLDDKIDVTSWMVRYFEREIGGVGAP